MIWVYFDASALVKRYSVEDGTELVNELFRQLPTSQMSCATIGVLEIVAVLARKRNDGRLPPNLFTQSLLELNQEVIADDAFNLAAVNDELIMSAMDLITKHNINATDAIILRSCLNLQQVLADKDHDLILWSSDKRLLRATQQEGIATFDPEIETIASLKEILRQ